MTKVTYTPQEFGAICDWLCLEEEQGLNNWHFDHRWGKDALALADGTFSELFRIDKLSAYVEDDVAEMLKDLPGFADECGFHGEDYDENGKPRNKQKSFGEED